MKQVLFCPSAHVSQRRLLPSPSRASPCRPDVCVTGVAKRRTSTTLTGSGKSRPSTLSDGPSPPARRMSDFIVSISCSAMRPRSARSRPPGWHKGIVHDTRRLRGATARATTEVAGSTCCPHSGARPRTTTTRSLSARSATTSRRNWHRRSNGSISVSRRSGRASASGIPGRPAPDPTSATRSPGSSASVSAALLTRCRSQIRSPSRGPSRPRWVPAVTNRSANRRARWSWSPNSAVAAGRHRGGGSGADPESDAANPGAERPPLRRGPRRRGAGAPRPRSRSLPRRPWRRRHGRPCARRDSSATGARVRP